MGSLVPGHHDSAGDTCGQLKSVMVKKRMESKFDSIKWRKSRKAENEKRGREERSFENKGSRADWSAGEHFILAPGEESFPYTHVFHVYLSIRSDPIR